MYEAAYIFLVVVLLISNAYFLYKFRTLRKKYIGLLQTPSPELTAFLRDIKNHGYSFTRVDPDAVFIRSPKEYM